MKLTITLILSLFMTNLVHSADKDNTPVEGFTFSYLDIQKNCTAQRAGQDSLSINCRGNALKSVSRSCGGYISRGLATAKLNCGGNLWVLNQRCKIEMRGADYGEINCKL